MQHATHVKEYTYLILLGMVDSNAYAMMDLYCRLMVSFVEMWTNAQKIHLYAYTDDAIIRKVNNMLEYKTHNAMI